MKALTRSTEEIAALLDEDEFLLPSEKRAAVNIIELRTKLEVRTLFLRVSLSLNTALVGGIVVRLLLN